MSALCCGERDVASTESFVLDLSFDEVDNTYPKCSNREEIILKYIPGPTQAGFFLLPTEPPTQQSNYSI